MRSWGLTFAALVALLYLVSKTVQRYEFLLNMTLFEILNFNKELLDRLVAVGFKLDDCKYIELYNDYTKMKQEGGKKTWLVASLADKYGVSERKVYSIIKHLGKHCTIDAV